MKKKLYLIVALILIVVFVLASCGSSQEETKPSVQGTSADGVILTVSGYNQGEKNYTYEDLENLGVVTYSYSGRNKENNNERQIGEHTGVLLKTLLEDAGYGKEEETVKFVCSDGYTRDYETEDLYDRYFYENENTEKGKSVQPLLELMKEGADLGNGEKYEKEDGSPLRLVFGQMDYDSEYTKDFNMQGWAAYVERIEVSQGDE